MKKLRDFYTVRKEVGSGVSSSLEHEGRKAIIVAAMRKSNFFIT